MYLSISKLCNCVFISVCIKYLSISDVASKVYRV